MGEEQISKGELISRILGQAKSDSGFKDMVFKFINIYEELQSKSGPIRFPDGRLMISNREHQTLCEEIAKKIANEDEDPQDLAFQISKIPGVVLKKRMKSQRKYFIWAISFIIGIIVGIYRYYKLDKPTEVIIVVLLVTFAVRYLWKFWFEK